MNNAVSLPANNVITDSSIPNDMSSCELRTSGFRNILTAQKSITAAGTVFNMTGNIILTFSTKIGFFILKSTIGLSNEQKHSKHHKTYSQFHKRFGR